MDGELSTYNKRELDIRYIRVNDNIYLDPVQQHLDPMTHRKHLYFSHNNECCIDQQ